MSDLSVISTILMRHWDEWEAHRTLTIDQKDIDLCLLVLDIQYQTQHYFFGRYAYNYFDNMNNEANLNKRRRGKTIVAFDSLPELFTFEDVKKVFSASSNNAHVIICRLKKDLIVEEVEGGKFKKIGSM